MVPTSVQQIDSPEDKQSAWVQTTSPSVSNVDGHVRSLTSSSEQGEDVIKDNPFLDPDVEQYWKNVYEQSQYECRHVFDANATWTEEEEKAIIRKLDWRVCLWAVSQVWSSFWFVFYVRYYNHVC
jgi:hypothetical protein